MNAGPRKEHGLLAWIEALSQGRITGIFFLASFLLYFPFLFAGFSYDDFFWITILEQKLPHRSWVGFWDVEPAKLPAFQALWYADSDNPGRFLRPIFSWIFAGSFALFGRNSAVLLHAASIALHAATASLVYLNAREHLRQAPSVLAGLIFLFCPHHIMTVGWISTMTDLLSAVFTLGSV